MKPYKNHRYPLYGHQWHHNKSVWPIIAGSTIVVSGLLYLVYRRNEQRKQRFAMGFKPIDPNTLVPQASKLKPINEDTLKELVKKKYKN